MKKVMLILICLFLIPAFLTASDDIFSSYPFKSATWKSKVTTDDGKGKPMVMESSVFYKNGKMRTEGTAPDYETKKNKKFVSIVTGDAIYTIDPEKNEGMKMKFNKETLAQSGSDVSLDECRKGAKKTGSEKVNGENCDVSEFTCKVGSKTAKVKMWARTKDKFPVRFVQDLGDMKVTVDYTDIKAGASIPDSKFAPDKNTKITDMDAMMKGMGASRPAGAKAAKQAVKAKAAQSEDDEEEEDEEDDAAEEAGKEMMKGMMKGLMGE
jgi:outer membrane lipoprotein-sorting protein